MPDNTVEVVVGLRHGDVLSGTGNDRAQEEPVGLGQEEGVSKGKEGGSPWSCKLFRHSLSKFTSNTQFHRSRGYTEIFMTYT